MNQLAVRLRVVLSITTTATTTLMVVEMVRRVGLFLGTDVPTIAVLGPVQMEWEMLVGTTDAQALTTATPAQETTIQATATEVTARRVRELRPALGLTMPPTAGMKLGAHGRPLLMQPSHQSHPAQTVPIGYTTTAQAVQTSISFRQEQTP